MNNFINFDAIAFDRVIIKIIICEIVVVIVSFSFRFFSSSFRFFSFSFRFLRFFVIWLIVFFLTIIFLLTMTFFLIRFVRISNFYFICSNSKKSRFVNLIVFFCVFIIKLFLFCDFENRFLIFVFLNFAIFFKSFKSLFFEWKKTIDDSMRLRKS